MKKSDLIVILCKTDSTQIVKLVKHELQGYYGKENVKRIVFNYYGDLDERANTFINYALKSNRAFQVVQCEGSKIYMDQLFQLFANKLNETGVKFAFVFDTSTPELLYSGKTLKENVLNQIKETKELIDFTIK